MKIKNLKLLRVVIFLLIFSLFFMTAAFELKRSEIEKNTQMIGEMNRVKNQFENLISSRLIAMNGLASFINVKPDFTQMDFETYVQPIVEGYGEIIRNMTFITDTTITKVYPYETNKTALGVDLAGIPAQKDMILLAKETGESTFIAPVDLVQGGRGIVARIPIRKDDLYYGQVAMVFNYDEVMQSVGLLALSESYNIALTQVESPVQNMQPIWSSGTILERQSKHTQINLFDSKLDLVFSTKAVLGYFSWLYIAIILVGVFVSALLTWLFTKLLEAKEALLQSNQALEIRVTERTADLTQINVELNETLEILKTTQKKLIESEKMASLSSMVIGVAHEMNTPLGTGMTASSHLKDLIASLKGKVTQQLLMDQELKRQIMDIEISGDLIQNSFEKASKSIDQFKQISLEHFSTHEKDTFELKALLFEVIGSLDNNQGHVIEVQCPVDYKVFSYKEAFMQVIKQLVANALKFGFDDINQGHVSIHVKMDSELLEILIKDNGKGIPDQIKKHIFDPFFTTNRGFKGGSGLGLYMVYNIVTFKLNGAINCKSAPEEGTQFALTFALKDLLL